MPRITQIKAQKKPGRFNIFIEGKFSLALPAEVVVRENLKTGQSVSSEEIQQLIKENEFQVSLDKTFKFISYRPRSKREVLVFLKKKQLGEQTEAMILEKLEALEMIKDLDFAHWWVEQRKTFRPKSARLLKLELRQKGIRREIIDQVLAPISTKDEFVLAERVLRKKEAQLSGLSKEEFKKKAFGFLLRRGFSYEVIGKAIEKKLAKE